MVKTVESQQKKILRQDPERPGGSRDQPNFPEEPRPAKLPGRASDQPEPPGKDTFQPVELLQATPHTLPAL